MDLHPPPCWTSVLTPHTLGFTQVLWLYRLAPSLRRSRSPLLRHTLRVLSDRLDEGSIDGLCSIALSMAYVETQRINPSFATRVLQHAVERVPEGHSYTWQLSNMIWSIARLDHACAPEHIPVCVGGWVGGGWGICPVCVE